MFYQFFAIFLCEMCAQYSPLLWYPRLKFYCTPKLLLRCVIGHAPPFWLTVVSLSKSVQHIWQTIGLSRSAIYSTSVFFKTEALDTAYTWKMFVCLLLSFWEVNNFRLLFLIYHSLFVWKSENFPQGTQMSQEGTSPIPCSFHSPLANPT